MTFCDVGVIAGVLIGAPFGLVGGLVVGFLFILARAWWRPSQN